MLTIRKCYSQTSTAIEMRECITFQMHSHSLTWNPMKETQLNLYWNIRKKEALSNRIPVYCAYCAFTCSFIHSEWITRSHKLKTSTWRTDTTGTTFEHSTNSAALSNRNSMYDYFIKILCILWLHLYLLNGSRWLKHFQ